jgi:hypothetical protein
MVSNKNYPFSRKFMAIIHETPLFLSSTDGLATTTTHDPVMSVPYFAPREEKKEESFEEMLKKLKAKMSARQS